MKNFLSQFKTWVHVAAGAIMTGATVYATNDAVHNAVNTIIGSNKKTVALVGALASIALTYAKSTKQ